MSILPYADLGLSLGGAIYQHSLNKRAKEQQVEDRDRAIGDWNRRQPLRDLGLQLMTNMTPRDASATFKSESPFARTPERQAPTEDMMRPYNAVIDEQRSRIGPLPGHRDMDVETQARREAAQKQWVEDGLFQRNDGPFQPSAAARAKYEAERAAKVVANGGRPLELLNPRMGVR